MRIEYLQYLLEIDKQHSISSAARALYMGQTTLSSVVKSVEDELGFLIFQRTPRGMISTPAGERLLDLARQMVVNYEDILALKNESVSTSKPVSLLTSSSLGAAVALPLNRLFLEAEPRATLIFNEVARNEVVPQILDNKANIGLTHLLDKEVAGYQSNAQKYGVEFEMLGDDHFYLVTRADHPLAKHDQVAVEEVYSENLAMGANFPSAPFGQLLAPLYRNNTRFTGFPNVSMVHQAVRDQNMVAVLTGCVLGYAGLLDHPEFRVLPLTGLDGKNIIHIYLVHANEQCLRRKEKVLVECIREVLSPERLAKIPTIDEALPVAAR